MVKVPSCQTSDEIIKYLEALYYEQKLRVQEKLKVLEKNKACLEKQVANFKHAESMIKRSILLLHSELRGKVDAPAE